MQYVESAHSLVTREDIRGGVAFRVSDVQPGTARIREHVEDVKFRLGRIEIFLAWISRMKKLPLLPDRLPFWLDLIERIRFAALATHQIMNQESRKTGKRNGLGASFRLAAVICVTDPDQENNPAFLLS